MFITSTRISKMNCSEVLTYFRKQITRFELSKLPESTDYGDYQAAKKKKNYMYLRGTWWCAVLKGENICLVSAAWLVSVTCSTLFMGAWPYDAGNLTWIDVVVSQNCSKSTATYRLAICCRFAGFQELNSAATETLMSSLNSVSSYLRPTL